MTIKQLRPLFLLLPALGFSVTLAAAEVAVPRGADELFWVPTLEQGLAMAKTTGRPLFLMGYSLVPDGTTYSKLGADYCSGVF